MGQTLEGEPPTEQVVTQPRQGAPATAEPILPGGRAAPTRDRPSPTSRGGAGGAWEPASLAGRSCSVPRSDSMSSSMSVPVHTTARGTGVLCQALVVPKATGVTLGIEGELRPCQQETVVDITMKDSTSNECLLQLFVSETGKDRGMLLESVLKVPIAILDTGPVFATGAAPREVIIRNDMDLDRAPFAVVRMEPGARRVFKATRGALDGREGEPLLAIRADVGCLRGNIVSAEGKLVASMETRSEVGGQTQRFLNICQGADSALVLCVVFAAMKLG